MPRVQVFEGEGKEPAIKLHWRAGRFTVRATGPERSRIALLDPTADTFVEVDGLKMNAGPIDVTVNSTHIGRRRMESVHFSYDDQSMTLAGYTRKITIHWVEV